jgi:hypothetical protein
MKTAYKFAFYGALALYAVYNVMWLISTSFSFGSNDSRYELMFFLLTFAADVPVMWLIRKRPVSGGASLLVLLGADIVLASHYRVLSPFSIMWWYSPKLIAFSAYKLRQPSLTGNPGV